jgi:hypothetical protein
MQIDYIVTIVRKYFDRKSLIHSLYSSGVASFVTLEWLDSAGMGCTTRPRCCCNNSSQSGHFQGSQEQGDSRSNYTYLYGININLPLMYFVDGGSFCVLTIDNLPSYLMTFF